MGDKIFIKKKELQGEDGYKVLSIRIKNEMAERLNILAGDANRSRNEVVNILLDYGISNCEVIEQVSLDYLAGLIDTPKKLY